VKPSKRDDKPRLDGAARRALRASSARRRSVDDIAGERVAMRTLAPAAGDRKRGSSGRGKRKDKSGGASEGARAPSEGGEDASDRKISLDEDFLVEGKLEKPNAFYILRRSQSGYDWARLDAKFLPLVLESVQDPLF
jgi:hypothetical protein